MKRSVRTRTDNDDDDCKPPAIPRDEGATKPPAKVAKASTKTFPGLIPKTVAHAPTSACSRLHTQDDLLEEKRRAAGHGTGDVRPGAVAVAPSSPTSVKSTQSHGTLHVDKGRPSLQVPMHGDEAHEHHRKHRADPHEHHRKRRAAAHDEHHRERDSKRDIVPKERRHKSSHPKQARDNQGVEGSFQHSARAGLFSGLDREKGTEEEKVEEEAPYEERGKSSQEKHSANFASVEHVRTLTNENAAKKKHQPPLVERVPGPHIPPVEEDPVYPPVSMADAGLAIAAEVVPGEQDLEAQVQERVHQERDVIISEVQKQIMAQAEPAEVMPFENLQGSKNRSSRNWKNWILILGLLATVIAVVVVLVMVLKPDSDPDPDPTAPQTEPPTPAPIPDDVTCTLCADGTIPENLDALTLGEEDTTCSEFSRTQMQLNATSEACVQGQAEAWRFCSCPTLPPLSENASCSLCSNVSIPLENPQFNVDNKACAEWNLFMAHVASNPSECVALRADLGDVVDQCKCASEPTFLQYLTHITYPISGDVIFEEGTSQNVALNWLATQDPASLSAATSITVLLQRYVLAVIYFATGGPSWENKYGFLSSADICSWNDGSGKGVICLGSVVSEIMLDSNSLNGALPFELTTLTSLALLSMRNNQQLTGSIPQTIGDLTDLEEFDVYFNSMTGTIPSSLFNIQTLQYLLLDGNKFTGPLPSTIGNSLALEWLTCSGCSLSGTIPHSIGDLGNLMKLDLDANNFTGGISAFSGNTMLQELYLNENEFTGTLPSALNSLSRLERLSLHHNFLTGTIPQSIGSLLSLSAIAVSENSLVGSIPPFASEQISQIFLYGNELNGTLDEFFNSSASAALTVLRLDDNKLTGTIPEAIGNFVQLEQIALFQNQLTGTIPSTLGNLVNAKLVAMGQNNLNGTLPSSFGNLSKVELLGFNVNFLTGTIPRSIGALPSLVGFDVHQNFLVGDIPPFTGQQISEVWLYGNLLTGSLDEFFNLTSSAALKIIRFEDNRLLGSLPETIGNFLQLEEININENLLNGPIPSSLGNLANALIIRLNDAGVTGTIPTELGSLINLEYLDLGVNDLSGTVPIELGNCMSLVSLALAQCGLSGSFPTNVANLPELETLLLQGNDFTNDFDETVCTRANEIDRLIANCLDNTVDCSCCTMCCNEFGNNCVDN